MSNMRIREITHDDLSDIKNLLCEGFPRRSEAYWHTALQHLDERPEVEGYPRFGYLLEVEGKAEGVILLLTSSQKGRIFSNLSSWYVREPHRKFAAFLFQRSMRTKGGTYVNLSPSAVALPIAQAFGFKPYTQGMLLMGPLAAFKSGSAKVSTASAEEIVQLCHEDHSLKDVVQRQIGFGCRALKIEDDHGPMLTLYRSTRFKRYLPAAQFLFGDVDRIVAAAGPLYRALAQQGFACLLLDRPENLDPGFGIFALPNRGIRYAKGTAPKVGDLLETELSVFG
ncbi:hypothetical protein [Pseudorhodobacter aquimaris]|uniref:hypothetical protein n=1 Tax=Pseudorhodobacter aquimaris TaxID=687412 RepID=UPI00067B7FE1|nr:hypothetical protein [Pseudorhodobacter aquimaris]